MMDLFFRSQWPSKMLRHNISMLWNVSIFIGHRMLPTNENHSIPKSAIPTISILVMFFSAFGRSMTMTLKKASGISLKHSLFLYRVISYLRRFSTATFTNARRNQFWWWDTFSHRVTLSKRYDIRRLVSYQKHGKPSRRQHCHR